MKTTAEFFEQVDAVGSAVGTTRAAVRRPILSQEIMCSEQPCRARPDAGLGHLQKMDLWSWLHARDKQDGLRLRAAGDQTIKQRHLDHLPDARSRSSFLLGT